MSDPTGLVQAVTTDVQSSNDNPDLRRRRVLGGLAVLGAAAPLLASCQSEAATPEAAPSAPIADMVFDYNDPKANVAAMARLAGDLDPTKVGRVRYSGRAFGVVPGEPVRAMYGIEGLGTNRIQTMEDGTQRFMFSEFAVYTDLETGEPLERWTNPFTNEALSVWHQRNGPVNFGLSPAMNAFGAFQPVESAPAFRLPWVQSGDYSSFALDVVSNRPNALDPAEWPRESSGETLHISEHSQYFVKTADLANPAMTSLPFHAALQSNKPWHPWMMMGTRPGKVFARMVASKVDGIDDLPDPVARYAAANLSEYLEPAKTFSRQYRTAYSIYKETMTPSEGG